MAGFDLATGTFALPWWALAAAALLLVVLSAVAFVRAGWRRTFAALGRLGMVLLALAVAWTFLDRLNLRDHADERRALETRMAALTARAIAPGSALACLDAAAGGAVIEACEKALFANPETVAAAVSYVAARLTLLVDANDFSKSGDEGFDEALVELRRSAELDRFGLVAHVLGNRYNCTAENCQALSLLRDPAWVASNLKERTFEIHVGRHAAIWSAPPVPVAPLAPVAAAPEPAASPAAAVSTGAAPSRANVNFPSAASIPPVSIMNNEPGMSGQNGMDAPKAEAKTDAKPAKSDTKSEAKSRRANAKSERRGGPAAEAPAAPAPAAANAETPARAQ